MALHLQVYGYLWSGARACYQYTIAAAPQTDKDAKQLAGDFESLIDWRVVQETNSYDAPRRGISRRIDIFKTLRSWRNGMTNRRFARLINS